MPNRAPAFQFYADDFLSGVADMTQSEVGAYMLLLCAQWSRGAIPDDQDRLRLVAKGDVSAHVMSKFPGGKNQRMERERVKQEEYRANRSSSGKFGANRRWHSHSTAIAQPMANHMANDSSPSPSPSPVQRESKGGLDANIPTWPEVKAMADGLCIPEATAKAFFDHNEGNQLWVNRHGYLVNVRVKLQVWHNQSRKGNNGNNRNTIHKGPDRNAGTANAGKGSQYAAAAERV